MRVLNIGLDQNIFRADSESRQRQLGYGQLAEQLHLLVLGEGKEEKLSDNVWLYPSGGRGRLAKFRSALRVASQIIKHNQINLISVQDPFFCGLLGWRLKQKFNLPLQIQVHVDFLSPYFWRQSLKNKISVCLAKFLLPRADGLRVVSKRIRQSLTISGIKLSSCLTVLPIFVDVEKIKIAPVNLDLHKKYSQFDLIILTAARLSPEKNIKLAIAAMAEIAKEFPGAGLVIVGSGSEEVSLKEEIKKRKLDSKIKLEPWTNDLASYYKTADLFLLTSDYEGWGMVVMEALAAGCPVVMTDVGCAGEVVVNDESGVVIPVGDKKALVKAVINLLVNNPLRDKFKQAGRLAVEKLSGQDEYWANYKKSWEQLL